jgi:uncharacterized lipoprotein YddW (UPF0748 family)
MLISIKSAFIFLVSIIFAASPAAGNSSPSPKVGVWVTVFSEEKALHSKGNADKLVETCVSSGITDIFLQLYRSDKAYYDSEITDRSAFESVLVSSKEDLIPYLIEKASEKKIKVHAWLNLMSLAHNYDANILKKYGKDVLTFDQKGRPSMPEDGKDELDRYYSRENQLFLEPGDWRVREYMGEIAEEILRKYPALHGLHLDYIRYPTTTPYIPGARFTSHGISYGYNRLNMFNFKKNTGLDPSTMNMNRKNALAWDKWRRDQVTKLAGYISEKAREISPKIEISAAIVPSTEKTYFSTFQGWTKWIEKKIVDFVVAMNYTDDPELFKLYSSSLMMKGFEENVRIGVGAYLMKNDPEGVKHQLEYLKKLSPGGIVIFSYDDIARNRELKDTLRSLFNPDRLPS